VTFVLSTSISRLLKPCLLKVSKETLLQLLLKLSFKKISKFVLLMLENEKGKKLKSFLRES
jgi:hypothetical protein